MPSMQGDPIQARDPRSYVPEGLPAFQKSRHIPRMRKERLSWH